MNWTRSRTIKATLTGFALYFAVAGYLKYTYVPQPDPPPRFWIPFPPFPHFGDGSGFAYVAWLPPEYDELADSPDNPTRSPLMVFENEKPLGPAHSAHADIVKDGHGRFSHWKGVGLIFSPSDNGDPNVWKRYSVEPVKNGGRVSP
jgi:hypothetical protein